MKPLLIAHRGDTVNFAENTIQAFQSAFDYGADGIELDIQFYNNDLIVVHDYLFDRNKNYPKLIKVLEKFIEKGRIEIEIKDMELDFLPKLKQTLSKFKLDNIELTSGVFPIFSYLNQEIPSISKGVIFHPYYFEAWMSREFIERKVINFVKLMKANVAHLPWLNINANFVKASHQNNIKIHTHIYKQKMSDQVKQYQQMATPEVDQYTFDDISLIKNLENI
jgi:glycerophosphoryl diester phosphodiesterase